MEEKKVTIVEASQFVRDVLSIGNVFKIDPNTDFIMDVTGAPATVHIGNSDRPIMIWSEKAKLGEHVLLNIFGETMNTTEERRWFYSFVGMVPGKIIRDMMMTIINTATSSEDKSEYEAMEVISPFVNEIDEKTKAEFSILKGADIAQIIYHKPSKTAQLQTKLFDEEFRSSFGKKIRTRSWKLFEGMFKALMSIENEKQLSDTFKATATILGMKQTDAMLRVLVKFLENIDSYAKTLLSVEYPLGNLLTGIEDMNLFYAAMRVFTNGGAQTVEKNADTASPFGTKVPLQSQNIPISPLPMQTQPIFSQQPIMMSTAPIGYQQPIMMQQQPTMMQQQSTLITQPVTSSIGYQPQPQQQVFPQFQLTPPPPPVISSNFGINDPSRFGSVKHWGKPSDVKMFGSR